MYLLGLNVFLKKEKFRLLFVIGILFLLVGCSKSLSQKNIEASEITASVIEDSRESCRLGNESDCSPIEIRRGETENQQNSSVQETANFAKAPNTTAALPLENINLLNCQEGRKCVEKNYRAYQFSNCTWISIEYCIYGCKDGECMPAPICKLKSFKCDKDNLMICLDGYGWGMNQSCDYKCESGQCINATPANSTNSVNNTNSSASSNSTNATQPNDFISDNCISVINFDYDTGNNEGNESFTLKNSCSYTIDMSSWTAKDNSNHVYTFPIFVLGDAAQVSILTGFGTDNSTTLHWGRGSPVWNNAADTLYLNISNGTSVLVYSYP